MGARQPFHILVVCTANSCRSPLAEHLLRAALADAGVPAEAAEVSSTGTHAYDGSEMDDRAFDVLTRRGIADAARFRSRALARGQVETADLILTAERAHRDAVVALVPRAARRTFTIREFGWLLEAVDPAVLPDGDLAERARAIVRAAAEQRGSRQPPRRIDLDLADPVSSTPEAFDVCAAQIDEAFKPFATALAAVRS